MKENIVVNKSFSFALDIIQLYKFLAEEKREYVLSKQLLRSATAVGALIREAQNAESKMDFVHKLGIAQKECDESIYWLQLLFHSHYIDEMQFSKLESSASELLKLIKSIIVSTKQNIQKEKQRMK